MFQALNHDVRYQLVDELVKVNKMSFTELSNVTKISKTALAYHLQILVIAGLVEKKLERIGNEYAFYSITDKATDLFSQLDLLVE